MISAVRVGALLRSLAVTWAFAVSSAFAAPLAQDPSHLKPPTLADPIKGLDLWRGARIGMDVAAVKRIFPSALAPMTPTTLTGGEGDALELAGVDLDGRLATAHFFFKDGGLISVQLGLPALRPGASAANMADMARLSGELTRSLGEAYDCGDRSESDITAYGCKWLKKPLAVRLWYMDVAGQAPLFYLAFRQADDPGYNL